VILDRDIYKLIDRYFEETILSLQDQNLSELSRQMAAFFLIEKAYKYLTTEEELNELFEINGNHASSLHYFSDVIDDFYGLYQQHTKVEKIFHPMPRPNDSWKSDLKTSLDELENKGYLKIIKSYDWSDYDLELQPKLTIYQKVPYSVISKNLLRY
jgi:hypothetical protein